MHERKNLLNAMHEEEFAKCEFWYELTTMYNM